MLVTRKTYDIIEDAYERAVWHAFGDLQQHPPHLPLFHPDALERVYDHVFYLMTERLTGIFGEIHVPGSDFSKLLKEHPHWKRFEITYEFSVWIKNRLDAIDLFKIPYGKLEYVEEVA